MAKRRSNFDRPETDGWTPDDVRVKGGNSDTLSYFSNFANNSGFMQHRYGALASSIILPCVSIGNIYFSTSDFVNVTLCRNYPMCMVISAPSAYNYGTSAGIGCVSKNDAQVHNNSNIY